MISIISTCYYWYRAGSYIHYTYTLLQQVSQIDHEMIQATALRMVFDILLLYGTELFRSCAEGDEAEEADDDIERDDDGVMADLSFSDEAIDKRQDGDEATHKLLKILVDFLDHEVTSPRVMLHCIIQCNAEYHDEGDCW